MEQGEGVNRIKCHCFLDPGHIILCEHLAEWIGCQTSSSIGLGFNSHSCWRLGDNQSFGSVPVASSWL